MSRVVGPRASNGREAACTFTWCRELLPVLVLFTVVFVSLDLVILGLFVVSKSGKQIARILSRKLALETQPHSARKRTYSESQYIRGRLLVLDQLSTHEAVPIVCALSGINELAGHFR